jgi:uncharacterized membrane protein/thiol-disulfide isomerase/thioredoxin
MFNILLILALLTGWSAPLPQDAEPPAVVVRAVLFYSPSCGHCHYVMTESMPPLLEKYGSQLQIFAINVATPEGQQLFQAAMFYFGLESTGVPFLVVGEQYLVGSADIPEQFPSLIAYHLANGGVDLPDIPGLADALAPAAADPPGAEPAPVPSDPAQAPAEPPAADEGPAAPAVILPPDPWVETSPTVQERLMRDPAGNALAIVVLIGMLAALVLSGFRFYRLPGKALSGFQAWAIPALCVIGLGVAAYLAFVETTHTEAVCGPVGDCNTVQQSEYARLFGILPIGVLGLAGYVAILAAWIINQGAKGRLADYAALFILGMTAFGTLFSVYLTFLEPFVIGATCAWCLASAIIMTALMLLSLSSGKLAYTRLTHKVKRHT